MPKPKLLRASATSAPKSISWSSPLELIAGKKEEGGLPTFKILANTGVPMRVSGWYDPLIVDLKGARFDRKVTPVILDHNTKTRIGHTNVQSIDKIGSKIVVEGIVSSTTKDAADFVADSKNGFPFQSSIGASVLDSTYVPEGKSVKVNGKEFDGPLIVATKTRIREITVCVLGADGETTVDVAATHRNLIMEEEFVAFCEGLGLVADDLETEQEVKIKASYDRFKKLEANQKPKAKGPKTKVKVKVPDVEASDDEEDDVPVDPKKVLRASAAKETTRIDTIISLCAKYNDGIGKAKVTITDEDGEDKELSVNKFKAAAIESDMTATDVELALLRASRTNVNSAPAQHNKDNAIVDEVMAASLCRNFGMVESGQASDPHGQKTGRPYGLMAYFGEEILEASHAKQYQIGGSIQNLMELQIRAAGHHYSSVDRKSGDFVAATYEAVQHMRASGFSTLNFTNVLENVMNKMALAGFDSVESLWRFIAGKRNLNDFKPAALYRLDFQGQFRQVAADGELKHISMVDTKKTLQANTFGAMITIDRKTIRDDDLSLVVQKASGIGSLGGLRIEESVFVLLLANTGSFFASGNNNLVAAGAGSALGLTGLEAGRLLFLNQVINGKPVGVTPRILLCGSNQLTLARQLYRNENIQVVGTAGSVTSAFFNNQFQGAYVPYASPYLNNASITDQDGKALTGQSATQWFLFADPNAPQGAALAIGFLDGRDQPYFDTAETQFSIPGGISFRSYLDWGVAFHIPQMAVKSPGA